MGGNVISLYANIIIELSLVVAFSIAKKGEKGDSLIRIRLSWKLICLRDKKREFSL